MARISRNKIAHEIRLKVTKSNEVSIRSKRFAVEVQKYWQDVAWPTSYPHGPHPYATGEYRESISIRRNRSIVSGRYLYGWIIESRHPNANFIEFGTGPDKPGSKSPWGPDTPTPAMAPAAKTAIHFRGTAP